jgi:serine/threonine-protein kinase RsbT
MPDVLPLPGEDGDCVWLTSNPDVATARERGRTLARALGFSVQDQVSVGTTISELAANMLTYARSGEIRLEVVTDGHLTGVRVVARDWGPAHDGLGVAAIRPPADHFEILRRAGRGTVVTVTKWRRSKPDAA